MSESPTTIYLIRHGETAFNVDSRFRGRVDIPLSKDGFAQAQELAHALCYAPFAALYSSPLSRAIQTAEAISLSQCLDIVPHPKFNNIDLGDWTDRPKSEIESEYPELWREWISSPERMSIPNAETIESVRSRSTGALDRLVSLHRGQCFGIVSHRAVLKPLIASLLFMPEPYFWKLHLNTASFTVFEHTKETGYKLLHFNLTDHLSSYVEEVF
jgi:probable phosphoglycerate mutase